MLTPSGGTSGVGGVRLLVAWWPGAGSFCFKCLLHHGSGQRGWMAFFFCTDNFGLGRVYILKTRVAFGGIGETFIPFDLNRMEGGRYPALQRPPQAIWAL